MRKRIHRKKLRALSAFSFKKYSRKDADERKQVRSAE